VTEELRRGWIPPGTDVESTRTADGMADHGAVMKRTVCTYAVGAEKFRAMALAMLVSVREHAAGSVDRYIVFTDCLRWRSVPDWVELVLLDCEVSADRDANWAIKPLLLSHPSVAQDLLLYIDADTTVYSDVIGRCFQWIQDRSLLVYMDFLEPDQNWGPINLLSVYQQAGYDARNLKINAGIIGRAPDALGRAMQRLYGKLFAEGELRRFFADEMYRRNDEPYLGLAVQLAYRELGIPQAETLHDLSVQDYALTIGANPALFRVSGGPIIRVSWYPTDIVRPAMVHWISSTQYFQYRRILWTSLWRAALFRPWWVVLVRDEVFTLKKRLRMKFQGFMGKRG
jgi:hypothetical protein